MIASFEVDIDFNIKENIIKPDLLIVFWVTKDETRKGKKAVKQCVNKTDT